MKSIKRMVLAGGMLLLVGTTCFAADVVEQRDPTANKPQPVDLSKVHRNQKLRAWVNSIKPAAGGAMEPATSPPREYWQQSVRRENRGSMKE